MHITCSPAGLTKVGSSQARLSFLVACAHGPTIWLFEPLVGGDHFVLQPCQGNAGSSMGAHPAHTKHDRRGNDRTDERAAIMNLSAWVDPLASVVELLLRSSFQTDASRHSLSAGDSVKRPSFFEIAARSHVRPFADMDF
jgi:hypothetical protein